MGEESTCNERDTGDSGSISGLGISPLRKKWHPTPIFLPEKSHKQRSLGGCWPKCHKESDTTEQVSLSLSMQNNCFVITRVFFLICLFLHATLTLPGTVFFIYSPSYILYILKTFFNFVLSTCPISMLKSKFFELYHDDSRWEKQGFSSGMAWMCFPLGCCNTMVS